MQVQLRFTGAIIPGFLKLAKLIHTNSLLSPTESVELAMRVVYWPDQSIPDLESTFVLKDGASFETLRRSCEELTVEATIVPE